MTASANVALPARGVQRPRVESIPPSVSGTSGDDAVELANSVGLILDPWEEYVLRNALGTREDGKWAAFEVGLDVPRQNGKGSVLEVRELAGALVLGEKLIVHSAHQFDTALEHLNRLEQLIEQGGLEHEVKKILRANGKEGIEFKGGQRIRFRARTGGGGRGFTGDCIVLDEAMYISEAMHGAMLPTLAARTITGNPQVWYTGSAVDQWIHEHGVVFARVRHRGHSGDPRLAWFEWSVDCDDPEDLDERIASDPEAWAQANPGLGIRIAEEYIENERRSLSARSFAVERLGVGDWPDPEGVNATIPAEVWSALLDPTDPPPSMLDPVVLAFDVAPDRSYSSVGVAGARADGMEQVEIAKRDRGTNWVVDYVATRKEKHQPAAVICDGRGPAASLIEPLERAGVTVTTVTAAEYAQACGQFYDACDPTGFDDPNRDHQPTVRHLGTPELTAALRGATKRTLADAWAWDRKSSGIDITPLVSVTLARWGLRRTPPPKEPLVAWQ